MLPERVTVSRKTPSDGKLELSRAAAEALGLGARELPLVVGGARGQAAVSVLECQCTRAERTGVHAHYFLESELLKGLEAGRAVTVARRADGAVEVGADT